MSDKTETSFVWDAAAIVGLALLMSSVFASYMLLRHVVVW